MLLLFRIYIIPEVRSKNKLKRTDCKGLTISLTASGILFGRLVIRIFRQRKKTPRISEKTFSALLIESVIYFRERVDAVYVITSHKPFCAYMKCFCQPDCRSVRRGNVPCQISADTGSGDSGCPAEIRLADSVAVHYAAEAC